MKTLVILFVSMICWPFNVNAASNFSKAQATQYILNKYINSTPNRLSAIVDKKFGAIISGRRSLYRISGNVALDNGRGQTINCVVVGEFGPIHVDDMQSFDCPGLPIFISGPMPDDLTYAFRLQAPKGAIVYTPKMADGNANVVESSSVLNTTLYSIETISRGVSAYPFRDDYKPENFNATVLRNLHIHDLRLMEPAAGVLNLDVTLLNPVVNDSHLDLKLAAEAAATTPEPMQLVNDQIHPNGGGPFATSSYRVENGDLIWDGKGYHDAAPGITDPTCTKLSKRSTEHLRGFGFIYDIQVIFHSADPTHPEVKISNMTEPLDKCLIAFHSPSKWPEN